MYRGNSAMYKLLPFRLRKSKILIFKNIMKRIVIAEAGSANNVGSMALIENAIKIARMKNENCKITVLSNDPNSVRYALQKDNYQQIEVIHDMFVIPNKGKVGKLLWLIQNIFFILYTRFLLLFTQNISWALLGNKKQIIKKVENADYIYCIGAERINDIYFKTALLSLYAIGTYIHMGKKLIHLSLTIGPVFNKSTIFVAKNVLNNSHAIFVRDQKSYDILKEWKCKAPYKFNSYDIALLQDLNKGLTDSLLQEFQITSGFIGLSVLDWAFRKAQGPSRMPEYIQSIAAVLDYIIEQYNRNIVITPTVINVYNKKGDDEIADEIIAKMKNGKRVTNIHRVLTPIEMATLFTKCHFSIVTRMHAAILCSGAGNRPVIAINYLYKLREYMKNIGFERYSIDIDYVNETDLKNFVDNIMKNYENDSRDLTLRQIQLRQSIISNLSQI